jgi:ATP synthase protein I
VNEERESQSVLSVGLAWASRIMTIALEFSGPALLGVGLDRWLRTGPWATISGAILGFVLGMLHTLRIAKELPGGSSRAPIRRRGERERADRDDPGACC